MGGLAIPQSVHQKEIKLISCNNLYVYKILHNYMRRSGLKMLSEVVLVLTMVYSSHMVSLFTSKPLQIIAGPYFI